MRKKFPNAIALLAAAAIAVLGIAEASPLHVLVFGDSQGDTGPTAQTLADTLSAHNVSANVVNKAVGGTLACQCVRERLLGGTSVALRIVLREERTALLTTSRLLVHSRSHRWVGKRPRRPR